MAAIETENLNHAYGERQALRGVSLAVSAGEIFGLLGPNGGGKSTLFRLLTTLMPIQQGTAQVAGFDVRQQPDAVRRSIGVTFQSPSLDLKLTVQENLKHQGHLYGLFGAALSQRCREVLDMLRVSDRTGDYVEKLSGGLKRRVEVAKSLLHRPQILLLDEPSTGLDPKARHELWQVLSELSRREGVTILVATHLMEEAEKCDALGILDEGALIAQGTPDELKTLVGGDCLLIQADHPEELAQQLRERFAVEVQQLAGNLRIEQADGHQLLSAIATEFPGAFRSLTLGKPTLEDVFIKLTGRQLAEGAAA